MYRTKLWSNSRFARWLIKKSKMSPKPYAATPFDWLRWEREFKKVSPLTFFVVEVFFDRTQDVVMFPIDVIRNIRAYVRNRFIDKTHVLRTNCQLGKWCDVDSRILSGCFNALKDYVEVELASLYNTSTVGDIPKVRQATGLKIFQPRRSRFAGLMYLDSVIQQAYHDKSYLQQAQDAKEIKELYLWWERRQIGDPSIDCSKAIDVQDNKMLIRLIKIRGSLWT